MTRNGPTTSSARASLARWRRLVVAGLVVGALAPAASQSKSGDADPFAVFAPWITLSANERARLARDEVVARTVPGRDGQLGIFVATRAEADADGLAAWTRDIAAFKRSRFVLAIQRFSDPPRLSDLDALHLDEQDLADLRRCRPSDCALKLAAAEMATLVDASRTGGSDAVQAAFRRVVLARVEAHRQGGLGALPPLADDDPPRRLDEALAALVRQSAYLERLPDVRAWLQPSDNGAAEVESFYYWSKEHYGSGKPVVSVTHVGLVRPAAAPGAPALVVVGKQLLATHYAQASVGLTMLLPRTASAPPHLVYLNRSTLDVLGGMMGGLARGTMERRMIRQVPLVVRGLRERLESGPPPANRGLAPLAWISRHQ